MDIDRKQLVKIIDHTLLRPEATREEIMRVCNEGRLFGFAAVCINPTWVTLTSRLLKGSGVKVDTVIGFPFGATEPEVKVFEVKTAINAGAEEVDVVLNFGALKSGEVELVRRELKSVVRVTKESGVVSKIIIETCYLTRDQKVAASRLVLGSGANFIKTSTGFGKGGATEEDVQLLREVVGNRVGIKASGGIRTYEDAIRMINAGASRIGSSSSVKIVEEALTSSLLSSSPSKRAPN